MAPRGFHEIEIVFEIDSNRNVRVSAHDGVTLRSNSIIITKDKLAAAEKVALIVEEAEPYEKEDKLNRAKYDARRSLEQYTIGLKRHLEHFVKPSGVFEDDEKKVIVDAVRRTENWLDTNGSMAGVHELNAWLQELAGEVDPIIDRGISRLQ